MLKLCCWWPMCWPWLGGFHSIQPIRGNTLSMLLEAFLSYLFNSSVPASANLRYSLLFCSELPPRKSLTNLEQLGTGESRTKLDLYYWQSILLIYSPFIQANKYNLLLVLWLLTKTKALYCTISFDVFWLLFSARLLNTMPHRHRSQPQLSTDLEGLELLGIKWLPALNSVQAKELTPYEVYNLYIYIYI